MIKDHDELIHLLSLVSAGAVEHTDEEEIADLTMIHLRHPVELDKADDLVKRAPYHVPVERYETPTGWVYLLHHVHDRRTVFDPFRLVELEGRYFYDTPENRDF